MAISADRHRRGFGVPFTSYQAQTGVVLVISLIILLLLTIIGLTAMQTTALEEKMAGNLRDKSLAFQAAESALRSAELSLNPLPKFTTAGTGGLYLDNNPSSPNSIPTALAILTDNFWISNPVASSTVTGLGNGIDAQPPVYIIQELPSFCPVPCELPPQTYIPYKVTVRATGGRTNTVVILQSIISIKS
jgi:type IV pilus assembly protein PilX